MRKRRVLCCHICSVRQGYGRKIAVIGLYSMCDYCFEVTMPLFQEEFEALKNGIHGVGC